MIGSLINFIHEVILPYGSVGVFVASLLEEVIAPIPSAAVQLATGFFFLNGGIDGVWLYNLIFIILIPVALGVALGSLVVYGLAYALGKPALIRWGKYFGVSWEDVERLDTWFESSIADELALFIVRTIPVIPSVAVSAAYGLVRFNIVKFLVISFMGTLVRATILAVIGWQVGSVYLHYAEIIEKFESFVLILFVVVMVLFILYRYMKKKRRII